MSTYRAVFLRVHPTGGKRIEEIALYAHAGAIELPPGMEGSLDAQTAYRD